MEIELRSGRWGVDQASADERAPRAGKSCNDWSERRPHLAGKLGVALTSRLFELEWVRRTDKPRAVEVTAEGERELRKRLGI